MKFNQVLMKLFSNGIAVEKVINVAQLRSAEEGQPVNIDQQTLQTTTLTFMDNSVEIALVSFAQYRLLFDVTNIYVDPNDNGIFNPVQ